MIGPVAPSRRSCTAPSAAATVVTSSPSLCLYSAFVRRAQPAAGVCYIRAGERVGGAHGVSHRCSRGVGRKSGAGRPRTCSSLALLLPQIRLPSPRSDWRARAATALPAQRGVLATARRRRMGTSHCVMYCSADQLQVCPAAAGSSVMGASQHANPSPASLPEGTATDLDGPLVEAHRGPLRTRTG